MYKLIISALLLLYISSASAIEANETALNDVNKVYYVVDPITGERGQSVLYLYIADINDLENAKKAIFFPHVDQFSRLEVADSK
jgi:hypothetical protein